MEKRYQGKWSTSVLADCCWTLGRNTPERLHKRQAKRSRKMKWTFILKCLMYTFLKYIINVSGFRRNRSKFWVFIVTFALIASKLIRNGYYYLRNIKSVEICCPVLQAIIWPYSGVWCHVVVHVPTKLTRIYGVITKTTTWIFIFAKATYIIQRNS